MLKRDQLRLNTLSACLIASDILTREEAEALIFNLGDLEDFALSLSDELDELVNAVERTAHDPQKSCLALGAARAELQHAIDHARRAAPLLEKASKFVRKRYHLFETDRE